MNDAKSFRQEVLRASNRFYGRDRYEDLFAQRQSRAQRQRRDRETDKQLDFFQDVFHTDATRPVKHVLDIACGGGEHVVGLAQRGYQCTGRDLSPEVVEAAEARAARAGVSVNLSQGEATQLAYHNEFDAVLVLDVICLLPEENDAQKCLGQIHSALRPGGVVVCNIYNPFTTGEHWLSKLLQHGQTVYEEHARGIRLTDIWRLQRFDPVHGVGWVQATGIAETPDGPHVFREKFHFRIQSYWGMTHYFRAAGFRETSCYPDWQTKQAKKPKASQLVFVARK